MIHLRPLRLLLLLLGLASGSALWGQVPPRAALRAAFAQSDVLDQEQRSKVLHHLEQDSASQILELDLGAKLLSFADDRLQLQTSEVGRWELRLLPLGTQRLSAILESVLSPQEDARLTLLDQAGEPLQSASPALVLPQAEDFLAPLHGTDSWAMNRLRELLTPCYYSMHWLAGEAPILTIRPSLLLAEEDQQNKELMQLISSLPTLTYRWSGGRFVLQAPTL